VKTTDYTDTDIGASGSPPPPPQMPLGTGDFGADPSLDPLAGASGGKKLNGGLLLIIAVMVIAAGGLFFMRKIAAVTASMVIDRDVEALIDDYIKSNPDDDTTPDRLSSTYNEVLGVLTEAYSERQVPLRDVQRDPFIIHYAEPDLPDPREAVDPSLQQERVFLQRQAERRTQLEEGVRKLKLKSILGGSNPLAIIDGKIVRVGDVLVVNAGELALRYRVKRIATASVDLAGEAPELALSVPFILQLHD
jgi:hypothetical protein